MGKRIEVYSKKPKYTLQIQNSEIGVEVVVVDENGEEVAGGKLIYITHDGFFGLFPAIDVDVANLVGLKRDMKGQLKQKGYR